MSRHATDGAAPLNQHLAFDWRYTLAETDLPEVRGTAELASLAVGFPMLEQPLVDFSLRLPCDYKLKGSSLRWFFKEALQAFCPRRHHQQAEAGFWSALRRVGNTERRLMALATDSMHTLVDRGLVRRDFTSRLLAEYLPAHPGYYGEMVWILLMLEQWLRVHAPSWRI